jgi:hypothetical protein
MTKQKIKELGTSLTISSFAVISITGIMMYFHILDKLTKHLHETLGLLFVAVALIHIYKNFSATKKYFTNKIFIASSAVIIVISLGFVSQGLLQTTEQNPKTVIINSLFNTNLETSINVLGKDYTIVQKELSKNGIKVESSVSINDLAKANGISPFQIVNMILQTQSVK